MLDVDNGLTLNDLPSLAALGGSPKLGHLGPALKIPIAAIRKFQTQMIMSVVFPFSHENFPLSLNVYRSSEEALDKKNPRNIMTVQ